MFSSTDVKEVFNSEISSVWDEKGKIVKVTVGSDNPIKSEVEKYLKNGIRILEVGCGDGKFLKFMEEEVENCELYGVDASENMISHAKLRFEQSKTKNQVSFITGFIEEVDLKKTFDLIVMKQVLHHINTPKKILRKLRQMLSKDGVLILMVPGNEYQGNVLPFESGNDLLGRYTRTMLEDTVMGSGLFPINILSDKFIFEFDNFFDYLKFMNDIGGIQKIHNYDSDKYNIILDWIKLYKEYLRKTDKMVVSGEYLVGVCIKANDYIANCMQAAR